VDRQATAEAEVETVGLQSQLAKQVAAGSDDADAGAGDRRREQNVAGEGAADAHLREPVEVVTPANLVGLRATGRAVAFTREGFLAGGAMVLFLALLAFSYSPIFRKAIGVATCLALRLYVGAGSSTPVRASF